MSYISCQDWKLSLFTKQWMGTWCEIIGEGQAEKEWRWAPPVICRARDTVNIYNHCPLRPQGYGTYLLTCLTPCNSIEHWYAWHLPDAGKLLLLICSNEIKQQLHGRQFCTFYKHNHDIANFSITVFVVVYRSNIVELSIYYEALNYETIEMIPEYTIFALMGKYKLLN